MKRLALISATLSTFAGPAIAADLGGYGYGYADRQVVESERIIERRYVREPVVESRVVETYAPRIYAPRIYAYRDVDDDYGYDRGYLRPFHYEGYRRHHHSGW